MLVPSHAHALASRPMTAEGADGFVAAGYEACRRCGGWAAEGNLRAGYCDDCLKAGAGRLELVREVERPAPRRSSRGRKAPRLTAAQRERKRRWNRARSRALHRLSRVQHPLYEVLLAEELAREGLDPHLDQRSAGSATIEREMRSRAVAG